MEPEQKRGAGCLAVVMLVTGLLFLAFGIRGMYYGEEIVFARRVGGFKVNGAYLLIPGCVFVGITVVVLRRFWKRRGRFTGPLG
jgi:uncharacterized membrane protein